MTVNITLFLKKVLCFDYWTTNIEACLDDPQILKVDVQKCWRLDFTGRPISEYAITDEFISCVGYWMEDAKSFLITYDREDPVSLLTINLSFCKTEGWEQFAPEL